MLRGFFCADLVLKSVLMPALCNRIITTQRSKSWLNWCNLIPVCCDSSIFRDRSHGDVWKAYWLFLTCHTCQERPSFSAKEFALWSRAFPGCTRRCVTTPVDSWLTLSYSRNRLSILCILNTHYVLPYHTFMPPIIANATLFIIIPYVMHGFSCSCSSKTERYHDHQAQRDLHKGCEHG